jgi:hypothetical protein
LCDISFQSEKIVLVSAVIHSLNHRSFLQRFEGILSEWMSLSVFLLFSPLFVAGSVISFGSW